MILSPNLLIHVVKKLLSHEAWTGNYHRLDNVKVDMSDNSLYTLIIKLVQTLLMLTAIAPSLPWNSNFYFGPDARIETTFLEFTHFLFLDKY